MTRALDILDASKARFDRQSAWRPLWQELAELLHPGRAHFTASLDPGRQANAEVYDGTPMQARRGLATAIDGLLKPSTTKWFWMKAGDEALNEDDGAKRWFDAVQARMWAEIYSPTAGFLEHSSAVDNDLSTFGWGVLWIAENRTRSGLAFKSLFLGDVAIDESADGQIDCADIRRSFTARQAVQRWGRDKLGKKITEALDSTDPKQRDKIFQFVQCVAPREDRDPRSRDSKNLPFASVIICTDDEHIVEETGYHEFPMAIPRWEVSGSQVYPRSPGMLALPDARTLQTMGHTLLVGGQMAVDPPRWIADEAAFSPVRTWPGGLTVVNTEIVKETGGRPMGTLDAGANIPVGREMQDDYRRMVEAAFFKNVFNLPVDSRQMTATEVMERKEEFLRTIGPTMGQLENNYIGVIVRRVFGIMLRAGALPAAPEQLQGTSARFEFMSPVQQAKRQIEAAGMARAIEAVAPILQMQPETADNFDGDAVIRDLPNAFGMPQKWLKPIEQRDEERAQRAQAMQAQQALLEAESGAGTVKTMADAERATAQAGAA